MVAHSYTVLPPLVNFWFQFLFHSPPGVLFTFPSRYSFTIGHQVVFSFTQWSGLIPTEFHVLYGTWVYIIITLYYDFGYRTFTFYGRMFQNHSPTVIMRRRVCTLYQLCPTSLILQRVHALTQHKFYSSFRFAHHYSGNQLRFLFLALLRCFSSCRSLLYPIYSDKDDWTSSSRVSPFGNFRIKA